MIADRILGDLERLWASLARTEPETGVVRASALTLIVLSHEAEDAANVAGSVVELMREHPHRAVIVRLTAAGAFDYRVVADCWRPFGGGEQICSERIEIDSPADAVAELAPVLLAVAAPDLPVVVWARTPDTWPAAETLAATLGDAKIVVDSDAAPGDPLPSVRFGDLAWARITPLREALAALPAGELRQVAILHPGERPPSSARYLAGWLGGLSRFERYRNGALAVRTATGRTIVARERPEPELLAEELRVEGRDAVFEAALARRR